MTKDQIKSKLITIIGHFPTEDLIAAYTVGSLNTLHFEDGSDIDIVLVWAKPPTQRDRRKIVKLSIKFFEHHADQIFMDEDSFSPRDAVFLQNFRKVEFYHSTLEGLDYILKDSESHNNAHHQVVYNLKNRMNLRVSGEMNLYLDSFILNQEDKLNQKKEFGFSIMGFLQENHPKFEAPDLEKMRTKLLLILSWNNGQELPAKKHWAKHFKNIHSENIDPEIIESLIKMDLNETAVRQWLRAHLKTVIRSFGIFPGNYLNIQENLQLTRYDFSNENQTYRIIIEQKKRLSEFLSWPNSIINFEDQQRFGMLTLDHWDEYKCFHFQLYINKILVGAISIHSFNWVKRSFEFGYWMNQEYEGNGYLTSALLRMNMEMKEIGWMSSRITAHDANKRSSGVATRLGMSIIDRYVKNGTNMVVYQKKLETNQPN